MMFKQLFPHFHFSHYEETKETTNEIIISLVGTIFSFLIATVIINSLYKGLDWITTTFAQMLGMERSRRHMNLVGKLSFCCRRLWKKILRWFGREVKQSTSDTAIRGESIPSAYLEAIDSATPQASELRIPELLGNSIKMFGNFDNTLVQELCKFMKSKIVQAGMLIFQPGDPYDSIIIVHTGRIRVYIMQVDGVELTLKIVVSGDCVCSMLSYIDIVRGEPTHTLALWAKAEQDTVILQLPMSAIRDLLHQRHDLLVQSVQLIAIRLHRINLTALYHYMGMSEELVNPPHRPKKITTYAYRPGPVLDDSGNVRSISQCQLTPSRSLSQSMMTGNKASTQSVGSAASTSVSTAILKPRSTVEISSRKASEFPLMATYSAKDGRYQQLHQSQSLLADLAKQVAISEDGESDSGEEQQLSPQSVLPVNYRVVARQNMSRILGLDSDELLKNMLEIRDFPAGTFVLRDTSEQDVSLIYVIKSPLVVMQYLSETADAKPIVFMALEGELVGGMSVIAGERINMTITAEEPSKVAVVSRGNVMKLINAKPEVVLHVSAAVAQRLSVFVREVDFALDWMQLESGKALYRQGDPANCMYIVLSGRLRSVLQTDLLKKRITKEFGKGDLVGIAEMLAEQERTTTVIAVRDTELVKMPAELLSTINILHPGTMQHLMRRLGMDILTTRRHSLPLLSQTGLPTSHISLMDSLSIPNLITFSTVVILPLSSQVPIGPFTTELYYSIKAITSVLRLTKEYVISYLGPNILEKNNDFRLTSWLGQQEDRHKLVLYQCDYELTPWTNRCFRQADIILLVAFADENPALTKMESSLEELAVRTQKELVLLHKDGTTKPRNTMHWLAARNWCCFHHHIRCPAHMFFSKNEEKETEMYLRMYEITPNVNSDFSRLARFLTGTSVGLVLGGGGARGSAHVGIIQAMREYNVPIDMICGVSIGALIGALWCMEHNDVQMMLFKTRQWAKRLTPWFWQMFDITFPAVALLTGKSFNSTIREAFQDTQIEDLWLPYFCVSTDITDSAVRVHGRGSLWRYVRASMTLAGYLPPMCDPMDGHMLLDGGYSNILPADIMQYKGRVQTILAVDVSKHDEPEFTNYGDSLSGFKVLFSWINPWGKELKVPSLPDLQSRLSLASGVRMLEKVRQNESFHYIRPPVNNFETLEFGSFEEIKDIGYAYARDLLITMRVQGQLPGPYFKNKKRKMSPH